MVPKLRFKEFNEKWSTATMAEIYSKIRNGFVGTASPFYVSDGVKYLQGKNIKDGFLNENGLIFINSTFHQKQSKTHLKRNDLVMVQSGHVGECAVIDDNFEGANCHAILVLTPKNKLTPSSFFKYYFYSPYGLKKIHTIKTGNTIEHILSSDLKEISVYIPNINEQNKIADFLSSVDEKISLLNKQYDLLCQYKKGIMQKIFSQELRFKDENGKEFPEWHLVRLGDYLIKYNEKSTKNNQYPVLTSSREGIYFQKDYFNGEDIASKNNIGYNVVPKGYFTYRHMSDDLVFKFNINTLCDKGIVSTLYPVFTTKLNTFFLQLKLNEGEEFRDYAIQQKQGGSRTYMYYSKLESLKLNIPNIVEQTKIANFISAFDDKIAVNKAKLDKLKTWKQGLLQQMFV
ncbi:restriction endonuclease subunit S [Klebsiella oxytoca]|uniref:Restriction endonuclease subunit S n=2 Tax=Klebsiella oxytoca TaxID=571 RepID=A0AAI9DYE1_KLEOX|nr:restriction endonuclease subunit S [Klebsiella oxytoca]ELM5278589.1 restriction endonuclease subunit S [Klebsiella oxytoca]MBZ7715584.1 restriction endonuclease subunit S [Klebsiella oxytoca]MCW9653138.1 restriction endonuclease subunit S [Klebsiella oxytoca]MDM4106808.1 restriction endonuclease subunit S [Klebsiella oxytoca]QLX75383.1 restriction endonuclease subunit S [Klebsiella oxytoca]